MKKILIILTIILILIGGIFVFFKYKNNITEIGEITEIFVPENDNKKNNDNKSIKSLTFLTNKPNKATTNDGYYYLSDDYDRLPNGKFATHLMYIDFKTKQEIHLCNNSACTHNTEDCTSVFTKNEFEIGSLLFVFNGKIYILSKIPDNDGQVSIGVLGESSNKTAESKSSVLYRLNLDGTNREKVYTFDSNVMVEDFTIGSENKLYFVTKKITNEYTSGNAYTISKERKLIYIDVNTKKENTVFSMDFKDNIDWEVIGSSDNLLVLYGIDFGRKVSNEEKNGENNEIYTKSSDVFATFNIADGSLNKIYSIYAPLSRSYTVGKDYLYYSKDGSNEVLKIDLKTGKSNVLAKLSQNYISMIIGDKILCQEYASNDTTSYFVDTNTGEVSHSSLINKTVKNSLDIIAVSGDEVLAIYDSDVTYNNDGSYTTKENKYGIISKSDLYTGKDSFKKVKMIYGGI